MIYDYYKERKKVNLLPRFILGVILLIIVVAVIAAVNIYLEIVQLDEIGGFSSVFWTNFGVQAVSMAAGFLLLLLLLVMTNVFISRIVQAFYKETGAVPIKIPNTLIAVVIALIGGFATRNVFYQKALAFFNAVPFGKADPIFNQDIGYYIFQRPFLMSIFGYISTVVLFLAIYTAAYYLIVATSVFGASPLEHLKRRGVLVHNIINVSVFFLIKALSYKFSMENILYGSIKNTRGASYVDVAIWKNFYLAAPFIILVILVLTFIFLGRGRIKYAVFSVVSYPVLWIAVSIIAGIIQSLVVVPNEFVMEKPYLKYSIVETREAYNINNVMEEGFDVKQNLTPGIINANSDTVSNIRVIDYRATLRSNNQLQSIRTFFGFHDGDIVNYNINGKEIPVFLAARELDKDRIPEKTYVNTMFKYTHGYGLVINPVNSYTSTGQVDYILKDIELNSIDPSLKILQPRIYYGELTDNYVVVGANGIKEIDKDVADETRYDGKGGLKLNFFNRLLFAIYNGDPNMVISGYISADSKLLLNRNVVQRVQKAAPFLSVDDDPYIILTKDGRLKWVVDAYTISGNYPYSQDIGGINYIRNSVKAVVDAYDGTVNIYIIDKTDPIIMTYSKIYPGVFTKGDLPMDVQEHMKYPEKLYKIQAEIIKRYHFDPIKNENSIEVFYNNQDIWEIAKYTDMQAENQIREIEPYYNMIKLPRGLGDKAELVVITPFTPLGKDNMMAWLAARNSYKDYGKFILFTFPKQRQIYGPNQVESQINQQSEISQQMTLWGKEGSRVFKGNLLAIPIEESILYVEPIYTESTNNVSIPQVKEVVLGYQSGENMQIVYGLTLADAMKKLFSGVNIAPGAQAPPAGQPAPTGKAEDIRKVVDTFNAVKKSFNSGDWEGFGKNMKDLEAAIGKLEK